MVHDASVFAISAPAGYSHQQDISGICFTPAGDRLYVGLDEYMMRYDIDTCARRSFGSVALC
jgi:hypothetical protein